MTIKNRTIVGVTSAIVAVSNAAASGCPDGRFFVGGTLTANFDRATIKYDGDETNENIKKWTAAIQQKLQLYITAKEEAAKTIDEPAKDLAKIVGNVLQKWLEMDVEHRKILFAGDSDNPAGSALALSLTSVNTEINKTNISALIKLLVGADSSLKTDSLMKKVANAEAGDNTKLEAIFQTAIKNLIEEGKIKDLFSLLSQNTLGVPEYQVPAGEEAPADDTQQSTQGQYLALLLEVNQEDLDAAREFVVSEADPLAQGLIKDTLQTDTTKKIEPYTAATKNLTDFITLGREAVSSSTDSQVLKVFYKEADKKEQVTDPAVVKTNLEALGNAGITTTLKDAGFNEHGRKSKRATGFAVGVKLGADYRFGDARLGAEIGVDIPFGKKIKLITLPDGTDDVTVKRRFSVDALLTAGWHVTPQFWFLVKGGVGYNKYSYNTSGLKSIGGPVKAALTEITKAYNASTDGQKTPIDPKPYQPDESIYKSHSTGKFSPIIGVGIRAAITDSLWVDLSYQHMFRTTVATKEKQGAEIKTGSEQIKVGLIVPLN